jgi:hypothetical protein
MTEQIYNDSKLTGELGKLPREIAPRSDLWPAIEAKLTAHMSTKPQRRTGFAAFRMHAVAATVLVAFAAGMLLGRQSGRDNTIPQQAASPDYALMATIAASEREYQAAFREFIPVGYARPYLGERAVEMIEDSWAELQMAETALLFALQEYPDDAFLGQRLLGLRGQQLDFMKQLAVLDQHTKRNT